MTPAQRNFLTLHIKRVVVQWKWLFQDSQLRATAGNRNASVTRAELDDLLEAGLMERSFGVSLVATPAGRASVEQREAV